MCTIWEVGILKGIYHLCNFQIRYITEEELFLFGNANEFFDLEFQLTPVLHENMFLKTSMGGGTMEFN